MHIGFFCIKGLENFVQPISNHFKKKSDHEVTEHWLSDLRDIMQRLEPCDIVWLEWANDIAINLTMHCAQLLKDKKVILRLHSYEALAQFHQQINWTVVDTVIFVSKHIQKYCCIDHAHQLVIENGIDMKQFEYVANKAHGTHVAIAGLFSHKKGVMLLAHAFASLPDNFNLHIAGEWQSERERVYLAHMVNAFNMQDRVHFYGRIDHDQMAGWMKDKNYVLCTSPWESQNLSICEAMATGTKPLVHNFWGADQVYLPKFIWTSFDDLNHMVHPSSEYDSLLYREYVERRFNHNDKVEKLDTLFNYLCA